jgi:hypothetical protein
LEVFVEREHHDHTFASSQDLNTYFTAPDRLTPANVEALLVELGGLTSVLNAATPPERAAIYQGLGLHLVY